MAEQTPQDSDPIDYDAVDYDAVDYDAVAASLPTDQPERAADGLRQLMEHPGFRALVEQIQQGELTDDELREEATSFAHDLAARQELRRDE